MPPRTQEDTVARWRVLVEAVRLIAARSDDLDATLDALTAQVQRFLRADHVAIHLATHGGRVRRRQAHPLAVPGTAFAAGGAEQDLDAWAATAVATSRCLFAADYQREPRIRPEAKEALASVASALVVPLTADSEFVGVLFADWTRPTELSDADVEAAQVLGAHAAIAIRTARLAQDANARLRRLAAAQRVSAAVNRAGDLDTLLETLLAETEALAGLTYGMVALVDPDRRYVRGRVGRGLPPGMLEATVRRIYPAPDPAEDMYALVVRTGEQQVFGPNDPARHGPTIQRFGRRSDYTILTPIAEGGEVLGVLGDNLPSTREPEPELLAMLRLIAEQAAGAVARERLRAAARDAALLEGAVKTARALAHEINQHLGLITAYGDMLPKLPPPEAAEAAAAMTRAAGELGALTGRLQSIIRFEETDSPVGPILDIGAATRPPRGAS